MLVESNGLKKTVTHNVYSEDGFIDLTSLGSCIDFAACNLSNRKMSILMSVINEAGEGIGKHTPSFDVKQCSTGVVVLRCDKGLVYKRELFKKESLVGRGDMTYIPSSGLLRVNIEVAQAKQYCKGDLADNKRN